MYKYVSMLACLMAFSVLAVAQQKKVEAVIGEPEQPAQEQVAGPEMTFENETIDYGTIEQGSDPYRVFKFTNTGTEPLVIKHAKGSCGCTVPTYPKEPIAPGAEAEIKVRYDTKRIGKFRKTVTLTTNSPSGNKVLTIQGEVKKPAPEPSGLPEKEGSMFDQ